MPGLIEEIRKLFGKKDFYDILNIPKSASKNEVRKAYLKLSLTVHPDRVTASKKDSATKQFQALGKIYSVLSDDGKRALYDEEGTVDEDDCDEMNDRNWTEYWRLLFPRVKLDDVKQFEENYKGSADELKDLQEAYLLAKGDMDVIIDTVLCASVDDEPRFRNILNELIANGTLKKFAAFTRESQTKKDARKRKAEEEAEEAEKELKKLTASDSNDLTALIQRNQQSRDKQADAFFTRLAEKYGGKNGQAEPASPSSKKKSASGKKTSATASKSTKGSGSRSKSK